MIAKYDQWEEEEGGDDLLTTFLPIIISFGIMQLEIKTNGVYNLCKCKNKQKQTQIMTKQKQRQNLNSKTNETKQTQQESNSDPYNHRNLLKVN